MRNFSLVGALSLALTTTVSAFEPVQSTEFRRAGIIDVWSAYTHQMSFGLNQTLALVDDGCKPDMPE